MSDPIYIAIENRAEDLIPELDRLISALRGIRAQVTDGKYRREVTFPNDGQAQRLFWEWHTLMEHASYSRAKE
jgi:hypothetical protein